MEAGPCDLLKNNTFFDTTLHIHGPDEGNYTLPDIIKPLHAVYSPNHVKHGLPS